MRNVSSLGDSHSFTTEKENNHSKRDGFNVGNAAPRSSRECNGRETAPEIVRNTARSTEHPFSSDAKPLPSSGLVGAAVGHHGGGVHLLGFGGIGPWSPRPGGGYAMKYDHHSPNTHCNTGRGLQIVTHPANSRSASVVGSMEEEVPRVSNQTTTNPTRGVSLRCWVLFPLIVIMTCVYAISIALAIAPWARASVAVMGSLHDVVEVNYVTLSGFTPFLRMTRMAKGIGSMYFSNNTFSNPVMDHAMPLKDGMVSSLCVTLRDVDKRRMIASIGAFSLTKKQAALCIASKSNPGQYYGHVSEGGIMKDFYYMDPVTMEYQQPLKRYESTTSGLTITEYTERFHFDSVVRIWNESVREGREMKPSEYWVRPRFPPTYAAYVYPFFEREDDGTVGVGYIYVGMHTGKISVRWHKASDSGVRVMLVDPNNESGQFYVFANNWGQPLANVSDEWKSAFMGEPIRFLSPDDVSDPLMSKAIRYLDLQQAARGKNQRSWFMYGGLAAVASAHHIVTDSGVEMVVVVVTNPSYYLGPIATYGGIAGLSSFVMYLIVIAACYYFVELCLHRPLRSTEEKLRAGLVKSSDEEKQKVIALREVCELHGVCSVLRRRLNAVRTYMPDRAFDLSGAAASVSRSKDACASDPEAASSPRRYGEELKPVACSVAYVYYTPGRTRNPSDAVVELMMQIVVSAAAACGGCFEVQRPDYCIVSFGVQSMDREFAAEATRAVEFARQVATKLMARSEVSGAYRVIVESGAFPSGIVSGGGRSRYVLLCRNIYRRVGDALQSVGVAAAVTEETALLVRGHFRLLPFRSVFLEGEDGVCVTLYEVLSGDAGQPTWNEFEGHYNEAYDMMVRGNYVSALRLLDKAISVGSLTLSGESPSFMSLQPQRLRDECAARVGRRDRTPFVNQLLLVPDSLNSSATSLISSPPLLSGTGKTSGGSSSPCDGGSPRTPSVFVGENAASTLNGEIPRFLEDCHGNSWQRSIDPIHEGANSVGVAYMGMSATGVLALLKLYPLTELGERLTREELDVALDKVLQVGESVSLVQCLSYCHVPPHGVLLVWEYVPGGTLRDLKVRYGRKLPAATVKRHVTSLLRGLACLHERGLVQGCLCPETVVTCVGGHCRLTGVLLDAAPLLKHQMTYCVSPEEARGKPQSWMTDMYALGLLVIEMLNDDFPWRWTTNAQISRSRNELLAVLSDHEALMESLREGLLEPVPPPEDADPTIQLVVSSCLRIDPAQRRDAVFLLQRVGGVVAVDA
ncbi:protein kinase, putative [Trypanosoma brucei gambiense DAL972]|uniref:Protein kinase, putative n=1 Tax=Trypanosoma brucei gambiense (strain MHOM/CI/86/DAL972) TaxID=679716 RepID=C9ZPJ9_TRYB9|nr:protein kinase, putative [Trypanosoma brucei gambiense DAL972]CBH11327.1 protein kinase, putative [Trypanosoma brucei gambiense DAL972]|eukprot:XP_011773614.1 protein kinase, putative [Trypanosoma brucei gambiense DAL972]